MRIKKPTIDDVAALSGVGRATVSRVLNGGPNVSDKMRERVQKAVEMLDYKVNLQARFLAGGVSRTIMLVHVSNVDEEPNSYYDAGLELGAVRACSSNGFSLNTVAANPDDGSARQRLTKIVGEGHCDGMILTPPFSDDIELVSELEKSGKPVVCISAGQHSHAHVYSVGIDEEEAGYALGAFLVGQGHRRFAYIDAPKEHRSAAERLQGFLRALRVAGIPEDAIDVAPGNFTFRSGIEQSEKLLSSVEGLTALACANDDMAAGALLTAHRRGLQIPKDISITGFDDSPVSEIVWPPLTTVHQPIRQLGERAALALIEAVTNNISRLPSGSEMVPFRLVERESTGRSPMEAL